MKISKYQLEILNEQRKTLQMNKDAIYMFQDTRCLYYTAGFKYNTCYKKTYFCLFCGLLPNYFRYMTNLVNLAEIIELQD